MSQEAQFTLSAQYGIKSYLPCCPFNIEMNALNRDFSPFAVIHYFNIEPLIAATEWKYNNNYGNVYTRTPTHKHSYQVPTNEFVCSSTNGEAHALHSLLTSARLLFLRTHVYKSHRQGRRAAQNRRSHQRKNESVSRVVFSSY